MPIYSTTSIHADCTRETVSIAVNSTPNSLLGSFCMCVMCPEGSVVQNLYSNSHALLQALLLSLILILLDWGASARHLLA